MLYLAFHPWGGIVLTPADAEEMSFTVRIRPMALISLAIAVTIILGGTGFSIFYALQKIFGGF